MAYQKTQGIVLARTDYRENDRMITLLSPDFGLVDALCRGCRKPKSPLITAGELFCMGEYMLYSSAARETVTGCTVIEAFYPLRLNYPRLSYAAMMLHICLKVAQPGEPASHLYILLARSLKRLAYEETPADQVSCAFLMHLASIAGFRPRLNHCVRCGKAMGEAENAFLIPQEGGVCCSVCGSRLPLRQMLPAASLAWLRAILTRGIDKVKSAPPDIPYQPMADFVACHLDSKLPEVAKEE
ncbi:MAG: DNA repair protein RecO [Christensenellales bacterium]